MSWVRKVSAVKNRMHHRLPQVIGLQMMIDRTTWILRVIKSWCCLLRVTQVGWPRNLLPKLLVGLAPATAEPEKIFTDLGAEPPKFPGGSGGREPPKGGVWGER